MMKANKTMKAQAIPNHRRRKDKKVESSIDSAAHNQMLKQQKPNNRNTTHLSMSMDSIPLSKDTD
jgi:hypothetical protein